MQVKDYLAVHAKMNLFKIIMAIQIQPTRDLLDRLNEAYGWQLYIIFYVDESCNVIIKKDWSYGNPVWVTNVNSSMDSWMVYSKPSKGRARNRSNSYTIRVFK